MDYQVFYPDIPRIQVYDYVRGTLGPIKKKIWTNARNLAFEEWEASGLRFEIDSRTDSPPAWPYCWAASITMTTQELDPWGSGVPAVCPFFENIGGAALQVDYALMGWFEKYHRQYLRSLIAHEVGHALGFSHVGTGIMRWGYDPDASKFVTPWEIEEVKEYFKL